jgi:hypothetical protein
LTDRMQTAYQLELMWVGITTFNPTARMTRAEFGTVLSRALRGSTYNTLKGTYYESHLQQLQKIWIMKDISAPFSMEIRGYVMLMLMRAGQ